MKIELDQNHDRFCAGTVIHVSDDVGAQLIADGVGHQVPDDTRARKNTAPKFDGCAPIEAEQVEKKAKAAK